jgi:hypothetical protein
MKPTRLDAMRVRADHPRIWLDPERVRWLRGKVEGRSTEEVAQLAGGSAVGMALTSVATGDAGPCRAAIERHVVHAEEKEPARPMPLFHLALIYDWCHAHLSAGEGAKLRSLIAPQMEKDMANGRLWRSFHNSGHTHAFTLTAAALALQGDDPIADRALAFLRPELEDMLDTFDRVFPDGEWAEGADYDRHASHHALRTFLALKAATGQDFIAASPHLRNVANYIFYATKPNGLMFPGDDNDWPYLNKWEHSALLMLASEYRDPYAQWFLNHCPVERFQLEDGDRWARLLWHDGGIPEKPLDALPLSRIFRGKGLVLARTGWGFHDRGAAWLAFSNGDYFGDHDHLDVNAFQIYRGGELAIDSGRYDDDWDFTQQPDQIARSQLFNYYQRTIAHNTMLVHDPDEVFGRGLLNDGGQRHLLWRGPHRNVPEDYAQATFPSDDGVGRSDWATNPGRWERGDITAYTANPDFVYVRGDGTAAYAPSKVSAFVRELLFVRPRLVVVFDRVVSTNPRFEKTWLLHTVDEPRLAPDGAWFEVTEGAGRLFGVPILPGARRLEKVGGPGHEFTVAGVAYRAGPQSELNPTALHYGELPGAWRIEERPAAPQAEDYFANVMLLTERASDERPQIERVVNDVDALAFQVRHTEATTVSVRFAKGKQPGLTLKIERSGNVVFDGVLPDRVALEEGRR